MGLDSLGEAGIIARLSRTPLADGRGVIRGIGDDAAVYEFGSGLASVVSHDLLVEGVDFRLGRASAGSIGAKAAAANLSDIAAMGATPRHAFLGLALPPATPEPFLDELARGFSETLAGYGVNLLGGDLSRIDGPLVVSVTIVGSADRTRLVYRSGARAGDLLCVTGPLGEAACGLRLSEGGLAANGLWRGLVAALDTPRAHVAEGLFLASTGAVRAMIDLSDGLAHDAGVLASASGVGAEIEARRLPVSPLLADCCREQGWDARALALEGGEDFCLLAALDPAAAPAVEASFAERFGRPLWRLGQVTQGAGLSLVSGTESRPLEVAGFDHFRR